MVATTRRAATACHAFLRALHARATKLRNHRYDHYLRAIAEAGSSSSSSSTPLLLLCAAAALLLLLFFFFPRAVTFFLPLAASTSAFCATTYLSTTTDPNHDAPKEVVLVRGGAGETGTLQVYADADASLYNDWRRSSSDGVALQVGCFLRKSATRGVDEDGEEVVLAGRLLVPAPTATAAGALEEELASLQVDRLAEGVWNSYFGRWSTWNHYYAVDGCDEDD